VLRQPRWLSCSKAVILNFVISASLRLTSSKTQSQLGDRSYQAARLWLWKSFLSSLQHPKICWTVQTRTKDMLQNMIQIFMRNRSLFDLCMNILIKYDTELSLVCIISVLLLILCFYCFVFHVHSLFAVCTFVSFFMFLCVFVAS